MLGTEELCRAVVSALRSRLSPSISKPASNILVMEDERAIPTAGEEFIGVTGDSTVNTQTPNANSKLIEHTVLVNYTRRLNGVPHEKVGSNKLTMKSLIKLIPSIYRRCDQIADIVDDSRYLIMGEANELLIERSAKGCFLTPIGFISMDAPQQKDADHWNVEEQEEEQDALTYVGLLVQLRFGGAQIFEAR